MTTWVLHVHLDQFIAAVEVLRRPELRGLPAVVGGDGDPAKRGVVSTASYEARAFGVHSGLALRTARLCCPDAVFLPVDTEAYEAASAEVMAALAEFDAVVEVALLDEAFLAADTDDPEALARRIQDRIRAVTSLECTVGIGENKLGRPSWPPGSASPPGSSGSPTSPGTRCSATVPPTRCGGSGPNTARRLAALGIHTVADLAGTDPRYLAAHLGPVTGPWLVQTARGLSPAPVDAAPYVPRSHGQEVTFQHDITDWEQVRNEVTRLARRVAAASARAASGQRGGSWSRSGTRRSSPGPMATRCPPPRRTPRRSSRRPSPRWASSDRAARSGCWASAPNSPADPGTACCSSALGRLPVVQAAYLQDLGAERLEPGQQPVQRGLVGKDAVNHGPDRFHTGVELLEVEQGLRWERPRHADLVVMRESQGQAPSLLGRRTFCCLPCRASARREPPMVGDSSPG